MAQHFGDVDRIGHFVFRFLVARDMVGGNGVRHGFGQLTKARQFAADMGMVDAEVIPLRVDDVEVALGLQGQHAGVSHGIGNKQQELSDIVQQARRVSHIDVEAGAARHFLGADGDPEAVQPESLGVEGRCGTETVDDGGGQRNVAHAADTEQKDGLAHRIHTPGDAQRAGVGCRQQARHHGRIAHDVAAQDLNIDLLVTQHVEDPRHDLGQGRQRRGLGQHLFDGVGRAHDAAHRR